MSEDEYIELSGQEEAETLARETDPPSEGYE